MNVYINNGTNQKVRVIKALKDYTLGDPVEWVYYEMQGNLIRKMKADNFYSRFSMIH